MTVIHGFIVILARPLPPYIRKTSYRKLLVSGGDCLITNTFTAAIANNTPPPPPQSVMRTGLLPLWRSPAIHRYRILTGVSRRQNLVRPFCPCQRHPVRHRRAVAVPAESVLRQLLTRLALRRNVCGAAASRSPGGGVPPLVRRYTLPYDWTSVLKGSVLGLCY